MQSVLFGVLQESVLGQLLLTVIHGLSLQHADDTQVYINTPAGDAEAAVRRLTACLVDIEAWLKASQLWLNPTKTQVMWLGSRQQLVKVNVSEVPVVSARIDVSETVCNLGVIVDSQLPLSAQVVAVAATTYGTFNRLSDRYHLTPSKRWPIRLFVAWSTANPCFMASLTVWWAGCSLFGMWLHVWCLALDAMSTIHITPVLEELHWLAVRCRVDFRIVTLVYLSGMAPTYLAADCQLVSDEGRRQLRFANSRTIVSSDRPTAAMETDALLLQLLGCGTTFHFIWNKLINFVQFKQLLKTFLSSCWECSALWLTVKLHVLSHLTYLLLLEKDGSMLQQQNEQTVLLHVCGWATGPLHPKVAGHCWELLLWSIRGLVAHECFNALIPDTVFFAYNLHSHVVWMLTLLALNPSSPSCPSPLACFHFGLLLPAQCGVHVIYIWPLTNDTAQFLSVLCFILVSNVVHVTYYLLNQFVFIICVVAREHEEQFLSLIF